MAEKFTYKAGEAKRNDFGVFWIKDKEKAKSLSFTKEDLQAIGKGIEDMPITQNASTEEQQDVLGNNNYSVVSFAKSMTVTPMKISGEDEYSQWLDDAIERDATLDELEQYYLAVKKYKTTADGKYRGWVQKGVVEPTSFADGLNGMATAHTVHYVGEKILGAVDPSTMGITPDEEGATFAALSAGSQPVAKVSGKTSTNLS